MPGNTAELIFLASASSLVRIMAPRGPRSVLCVVEVLEEAMGFDGKTYGLPSGVDNRLLYWNKDLFAQAGLDPEPPPVTWEELRAFALRLTRRSPRGGVEQLGFHPAAGQATLHPFAWQNGGSFQSADGKSATLSLAPNQDALQWLADLVRDLGGWAPLAGFLDAARAGAQHPFLTGQLAMQYQVDGWAGDVVARKRPDLRFGAAPLPVRRGGDPALTWSGGSSYVIAREAKNADAAWGLLEWLVSEAGWTAGCEGAVGRAKAQAGLYVPGMTGQPALDRRLAARYQTGQPALDAVPAQAAAALMEHSRFRELSVAAADLWDGADAGADGGPLRGQGRAPGAGGQQRPRPAGPRPGLGLDSPVPARRSPWPLPRD